jgi:hypothetical protein
MGLKDDLSRFQIRKMPYLNLGYSRNKAKRYSFDNAKEGKE